MLWACLLFPSLPLDVFARALKPAEAAHPLVVTSGGHYPRVVASNAAARAAGIRRDQLVSAALALAPDVTLRERDLAAEEAALGEAATLMLAFTPNASIAKPDAIVAEISGSVHLFGGLSRLHAELLSAVEAHGYAVRTALAPAPTAALLLARGGHSPSVLGVDALETALAPLPLALCDIDADTLAMLAASGIKTFGDAHRLPRPGLARRAGPQIVATLDRALGRAPDPRKPYHPPPRFERRLPLPSPVDTVESLRFAVHRLVQDFGGWLLARGLGAVRMSLVLVHERYLRARGVAPTVVTFALGSPARAPAHLSAVLRERLDRVALPAPVEAIVLTSDETAPLRGRNLGLLPEDAPETVAVPLVERLRARLGDDAVTVLMLQPEHRPELATCESVPGMSPKGGARTGEGVTDARAGATKRESAGSAGMGAPRPLWLAPEAQPLATELEAAPWILRDGPERIESGWWDGRDVRRDYFVAESPRGETVWIYRDHRYGADDGEWFLHGYFA
ncbi:MAG TPA: DNA polymerase Y family protein [Casimicrobiaceae bacterium]|nr:DNA polymerase Y family protein [Casimicrobiaceae bacterium]